MHHHDCPCPPAHHCHTDDVAPHHGHTDDHHAARHCHTDDDDIPPPMSSFGPTTMFPWPTATSSSSMMSYGNNNARHDVRVDVPRSSRTDDPCHPSWEDTPCGKCATGIVSVLVWGAIIALIIYAVK